MYGWEEMSTLNLAQLVRARDMAAKIVLAGGMDDASALRARAIAAPHGSVSDPKLRLPASVSGLLAVWLPEWVPTCLQDSTPCITCLAAVSQRQHSRAVSWLCSTRGFPTTMHMTTWTIQPGI